MFDEQVNKNNEKTKGLKYNIEKKNKKQERRRVEGEQYLSVQYQRLCNVNCDVWSQCCKNELLLVPS